MKSGFEEALARDLAPLGDDAAKATAFVVRGTDEDVLGRVAGGKLRLKVRDAWGAEGRRALFLLLEQGDAGVLRRLGSVWAAAAKGSGHIPELEAERWVEHVVWESSELSPNHLGPPHTTLDARMLPDDAASLLVRVALTPDEDPKAAFSRNCFATAVLAAPHVGEVLVAHAEEVCAAVEALGASHRATALERLEATKVDPLPLLATLVGLAIGEAKTVRVAALKMLARVPEEARSALRAAALDAGRPAAERTHAVRCLSALGESDAGFFRRLLQDDAAKALKDAAEGALQAARAEVRAEVGDVVVPPLPQSAITAIRALADAWATEAPARLAAHAARFPAFRATAVEPITEEEIAEAVRQASEPDPWTRVPESGLARLFRSTDFREVHRLLARPDLHPVHVARLFRMFNPRVTDEHLLMRLDPILREHRAQAPAPYPLQTVEVAARYAGSATPRVGMLLLTGWPFQWGEEVQRAYLEHNVDVLEAALGVRAVPGLQLAPMYAYYAGDSRRNALEHIAALSQVPPGCAPRLWELALEGPKAERAPAQACVARIPGFEDRLLAAMHQGSQEARAAAARWVGSLRLERAKPALVAALRKEKKDVVRAALMDALEALGEPIDAFVDRAGLAKRAEQVLSKAACPALEWPEIAALPPLRWGDTGEVVGERVVRAWLAEAHKQKSPAASPVMRIYGRSLREDDRRAFAEALLRTWIAHDVEKPGGWSQTGYDKPSTAIGDKGVLALVAALGGREIAPLVAAYLREWYGVRAAQCKALVQMLAWVEDRGAVQVLLATGTRFRTAGIRKEAEAQARELAERKGWTLDELADRTVPTAGLDDRGELELDYGARRFRARLGESLELVLTDDTGAVLKAPPGPRKDEDAAVVKAARAGFARSKKELATILKMQSARFYEAMCTQRAWPAADWKDFVMGHPVLSRLAMGVVWSVEDGGRTASFRPLGDGALSAADHADVPLGDAGVVRVAHPVHLSDAEAAAWLEHLRDFELLPLFVQFGRRVYRLPEERARAEALEDFRGHMIEAFKLRGRATRLGYARGATEDGGWFYAYEKVFPSLGLTVALGFSGNALPEENRTVALGEVRFERRHGQRAVGAKLGEVPAVLLSEARADMEELAGEGTGFDPDWKSKVR